MIEIESGIPVPPPRSAFSEKICSMSIGDSFLIHRNQRSVLCTLSRWRKRTKHHEWKFTSRRVSINGTIGTRVWRTA